MRKMVRVMRALGVASLLLASPTFGQGLVKSANHPGPWSVSVLGGLEHTDGRMDAAFEVMSNPSVRADKFVGAALSYQVARFWRDFTADLEFGAGRRFAGSGVSEGWAAVYFRYRGLVLYDTLIVSPGVSTGINYVDQFPVSEVYAPNEKGRPKSKLLHYFSPEIGFALQQAPEHELFVRLHHRSGVFGVMGGVHGGADVVAIGYRLRV